MLMNFNIKKPIHPQNLSALFFLIAAFGLPMFSALSLFGFSLCAFSFLISDRFTNVKKTIRHSTIAQASLLVFIAVFISTIYTRAPSKAALSSVLAYREFLLIPLILSLLSFAPQLKKHAINLFIFSATVVVLLSCFDAITPLPFSKSTHTNLVNDHVIFFHHIIQNVMSSVLVLLLLVKVSDSNTGLYWRLLYSTIIILSIFDILFLVQGRTGAVTLLVNIAVFIVYKSSIRNKIIFAIILACAAFITLNTDNPAHDLIKRTNSEVSRFEKSGEGTSAGIRLYLWEGTWERIKENPILGYGAGSYKLESGAYNLKYGPEQGFSEGFPHPHNELLMIWFENGLLGALAYMAFLISLFASAFKEPLKQNKILKYGVLGTLLVYSTFDVPMLNHVEGMLFWFLISVFFSENHATSSVKTSA